MEASFQTPLTPEQLAAVQAGQGFARVEDPVTHRVYFLIEQPEPPSIDDEYVKSKIDEAYAEGGLAPLNFDDIRDEFAQRQAAKSTRKD